MGLELPKAHLRNRSGWKHKDQMGWGAQLEWDRTSSVSSEKGGKKHWEYRRGVSDNWEYWCEWSDVLFVERVWDAWGWAVECVRGCLLTHFLTILLPPDVQDIPKTWLASAPLN